MEWIDEAIVLTARPYGETAAVVCLLTREHGRHAGLVAGGQGRRAGPTLQAGNYVEARWRARLSDQLGSYTLDLLTSHAAPWLDVPEVLAVIASATAVTEAALPERQAMSGVYEGLKALLALPTAELWGPIYVKWEMELLQALGYGLDLSRCAVSGVAEDLAYVSPRTGRAVTAAAAEPYKEKLLPLPGFLRGQPGHNREDICLGLDLTGHFLSRHVFVNPQARWLIPNPGDLPLARQRLAGMFTG